MKMDPKKQMPWSALEAPNSLVIEISDANRVKNYLAKSGTLKPSPQGSLFPFKALRVDLRRS